MRNIGGEHLIVSLLQGNHLDTIANVRFQYQAVIPIFDHFRESFISHLNKFNNFRLIKIINQSL